jgi:hypothetical protein
VLFGLFVQERLGPVKFQRLIDERNNLDKVEQ